MVPIGGVMQLRFEVTLHLLSSGSRGAEEKAAAGVGTSRSADSTSRQVTLFQSITHVRHAGRISSADIKLSPRLPPVKDGQRAEMRFR